MTAQETGLDPEFRQRVVDTMTAVLARLLDRPEPVTEDMRLMEELGLSSTLGLELMLELEDQLRDPHRRRADGPGPDENGRGHGDVRRRPFPARLAVVFVARPPAGPPRSP